MKKSIGKRTIVYPHPVFIVGSYNENGVANMMAASWGGICCSEPPCVTISLRKQRKTYDNIIYHQAFTVNIPPVKYLKESDFVGVVSGKDIDKFKETGLTPVRSELINAPYIKEFPLALICKLYKTVELGVHTQFIGEILDTIADEEVLGNNGLPVLEKIDPFCYDSADRTYYSVGEKLKKAYIVNKINT
jgi:flavin reductase (DIM6/NTAB) family NADH-FMN oxidoreductase RutF